MYTVHVSMASPFTILILLPPGLHNIFVRYIKNKEEQHRIVRSYHTDVTSGHFGFKKILAQLSNRKGFMERNYKRCRRICK